MRYKTPYRTQLRESFYDREGFLNGIFATPLVFIYNTKMVTRREAPSSIEDLASPKWSGKMAVDDESFDWLAAVLDYYGETKGIELASKIGQQSLQVRRGPTLITQLVAAGEFHVEIDGHHQEAIAKKKAGAPIDYHFPQPFVPVKSLVPIYMSARPPHPHAAALLADFLMSKKGQDIMYGHGRWVGHKSISGKGPDDIGDRKVVIPSAEKWGDRYQELIGLYNKLLLRKSGS
jgi:iron(III) transport system substrate-binding protein